jgi:hypothetical protein
MAKDAGLKADDLATVRWRDAVGTFDAEEISIARVMNTSVQTVDSGQVWLPLDRLQRMARMTGEATMVVVANGSGGAWRRRELDVQGSRLPARRRARDDQDQDARRDGRLRDPAVPRDDHHSGFARLSIFYRKKEIGTLMALGLTRGAVIRMFTSKARSTPSWRRSSGLLRHTTARVPRGDGDPDARGDRADWVFGGRQDVPRYSVFLVLGTTALVSW